MRENCYKCFRPIINCFCKSIKPIKTNIKFVFLIHPKEALKQKTGTGRLAHLSMTDSEMIIGVDFTDNSTVNDYIKDPSYYPVLLFPGINSLTVESGQFMKDLSGKKLLVFIIDGTWALVKKMIRLSTNLQKLQTMSFINKYKSKFIIKRQPRPFCLSTIESVYYLIEELKSRDIINKKINPNGLIKTFQKMINFQITCKNDPNKISYRKNKKKSN